MLVAADKKRLTAVEKVGCSSPELKHYVNVLVVVHLSDKAGMEIVVYF